jgi:hypothetical protein
MRRHLANSIEKMKGTWRPDTALFQTMILQLEAKENIGGQDQVFM